jgi:hypothetical protein
MFIFVTDQKLWARELMDRIRGCDDSLGRKDILKFIYCLIILFFIVYIFKHFLLIVPLSYQREYNNIFILIFIIFCMN